MSFYKIKNKISKDIKDKLKNIDIIIDDFTKPYISKHGSKVYFFNENKEVNLGLKIKNKKIRDFISNLNFNEFENFLKIFENVLVKNHSLFENDLINGKIVFVKDNQFYSYSLQNKNVELALEEDLFTYKETFYPKSNITKERMIELFYDNIFYILYKKTKTNELYFKNSYLYYKNKTSNIENFIKFTGKLYFKKKDIESGLVIQELYEKFISLKTVLNKKVWLAEKDYYLFYFNEEFNDIFDVIESCQIKQIPEFIHDKTFLTFRDCFLNSSNSQEKIFYYIEEDKAKIITYDSNFNFKIIETIKLNSINQNDKYHKYRIFRLFFVINKNKIENLTQDKYDYFSNEENIGKILIKYNTDKIAKTKIKDYFFLYIYEANGRLSGNYLYIVYKNKLYLIKKDSKYSIINDFSLSEKDIDIEELEKENKRNILETDL